MKKITVIFSFFLLPFFSCHAKKEPFATHFLVIIADENEPITFKPWTTGDGGMGNTVVIGPSIGLVIPTLIRDNLPFLISANLFLRYRDFVNQNPHPDRPRPDNYTVLDLSPTITSYLQKLPPFFLCIPKNLYPQIKQFTTSPNQFAENELLAGLLIGHFKPYDQMNPEYKNPASMPIPTISELALSLQQALRKMFISKQEYIKNGLVPPRWILLFFGHGGQYVPYQDIDHLMQNNYLQTLGTISCLDINLFAQSITELDKQIGLALAHINTCYGGGINLASLFRSDKKKVIPPYDFIVTTQTLTGDGTTHENVSSFFKFFKTLADITIDTDAKNAASKISSQNYKNANDFEKALTNAYKLTQTAYQQVYDALPDALLNIMSNTYGSINAPSILVQNIPGVKPIASNYFVELSELTGNKKTPFSWTFRIDKTTLEKTPADTAIDIPTDKTHILLYTNSVPRKIKLPKCHIINQNGDTYHAIVSTIPGDTFHIIDELVLDNTDFLYATHIFLHFASLEATKLFFIKKIANVVYKKMPTMKSCSIRIAYNLEGSRNPDPHVIDILVTNLNTNEHRVWQFKATDDDIKKGSRPCSLQEAKVWIDNFDKHIVLLKKTANAQESYRFLKNADIETLPWSEQDEDSVATRSLINLIKSFQMLLS